MALTAILFITASLCGIIWLFLYHVKRLDLYRQVNKFPGPPVLPIIGNLHYFLGDNTDMLKTMMTLVDTYSSPLRFWWGNRVMFGIYEADQIETILLSSKASQKNEMYKFFEPWVGKSIFTSSGAKWRHRRKLITPTFHQQILDTFTTVFARQSEIMINNMRKELNKEEFQIFPYISLATLDMICETAMGVNLQAQTGQDTRYVDSVQRLFEIVNLRIYRVWLYPDCIFNWTRYGTDQRKCVDYLHSVTKEVIRKKRSAYRNGDQGENGVTAGKKRRKTFLDLLLEISENGEELTEQDLREEVDTMIPAGNDTSAAINAFAMVMLATFPDIQDKAYKELCAIFGDEVSSNVPITNEHINSMEYMERVIKETMRLFPPAPVFARELTGDIKIGDRILPEGTSIIIGTLKLQRWDKYWPDPMKFDPDRFLPEEVAKRHPYCYIPFSAGIRNCLGKKYAMMAMKVLLATVLRRFVLKKDKFVAPKDIELKLDFMLKPVEPWSLRIIERTPFMNAKND